MSVDCGKGSCEKQCCKDCEFFRKNQSSKEIKQAEGNSNSRKFNLNDGMPPSSVKFNLND